MAISLCDIFDPIIIVAGTISSRISQEKQREQVIIRESEINIALKDNLQEGCYKICNWPLGIMAEVQACLQE